ncbi:MAG: ATP-dependent 6-phosphofructokinase, partial [Planctomycetota bacterium]
MMMTMNQHLEQRHHDSDATADGAEGSRDRSAPGHTPSSSTVEPTTTAADELAPKQRADAAGNRKRQKSIQRIGVLTGGGDCPGLNAVIRAVTKTAILRYGLQVYGIEDGFLGLVQNRIDPLETGKVSNILTTGGTILGTSNKCNPQKYVAGLDGEGKPIVKDVTDRCLDHIRHHDLDAIVVIGGDGTMSGARNFVEHGVNCIGVPKTIDNDLVGTDITFGFQTAVDVATEALDRIHTTAASHHRVMVVEVMGRNAGWIALHSGVAAGADVILIPESPFDYDLICGYVEHRSRHGKRFSIICVSEGA